MPKRKPAREVVPVAVEYDGLLSGISDLLEQARRATARSVNSIMTATYWEVGRRIVEHEQGGHARADYGEELLKRLGMDLTAKYGRGFSRQGLQKMRGLFLGWQICSTVSGKFEARVICSTVSSISQDEKAQTASALFPAQATRIASAQPAEPIFPTVSGRLQPFTDPLLSHPGCSPADVFPLSWSHYVRLMSVRHDQARAFYETEAIRGGWSVRQLDRQIGTQFYERAGASKNRSAMLARGQQPKPGDAVTVEEMVRDPYVLEFLDLKDQYSESDLEEALIHHLEKFLLELGAGFSFVARQKRIRIGTTWYRMDLVLFNRRLRCLVIIDLKSDAFTHADAGQMSLYLTYAREHLMEEGEAEPVGLILCSEKDDAVVHYAMGSIQAKVFASRYLTVLPDQEMLRREIIATKHALQTRAAAKGTTHD